MVQIACARELDFFHAFPWDAQDIFDADKNGSLDKASDLASQFKRWWLQWRILKGISFILQTMML